MEHSSNEAESTRKALLSILEDEKLARKELQKSEERLRLSTELAHVAVWEYDFTANSMSRSSNHDALYGLERQKKWDLDTFTNAIHPDDREFSNKMIQASVAPGGPDDYTFDFRVVHPNQSIHYLMAVGQVVERNEKGEGIMVRGCLIDITVRKQAEEKVLESETRYRQLFDVSPDAFFVLDSTGRVLDVNQVAEQRYGYSRDELLRMNASDLTTPELKEEAAMHVKQALETGDHFEWKHQHKDGRIIPVEINATKLILKEKPHILSSVRDITERKHLEEKLKEREERLSLFFSQSLDGFFFMMLDEPIEWNDSIDKEKALDYTFEKQRITRINHAMLEQYGATEDQFLGCTPNDLFAHNLQHGREVWKDFFDKGKLHIDTNEKKFDGTDMIIEGDYVCLYDVQKRIIGHFGIQRDITATRHAQKEIQKLNTELEQRVRERTAQLEATNKELESFSYSVSHDLRAPLRSIDGFSQALLEDYYEQLDEKGKNYLSRVRSAAQRMAQLIDDMLNLAQVTRTSMKLVSVDLSAMVKSMTEEFMENGKQRSTEFIIAPGLVDQADATLMKVALQNLLDNAWKFTSKKPETRIEFGMVDMDGKRTYFVRDNGAGFNMKYADKLFTPFQRLHQSTEFTGTGVSLATVQRIIHRHNGKIWAEGEEDKGATFYFTLNT